MMNTTEDSMDMDTSNQTDPQPAPRESSITANITPDSDGDSLAACPFCGGPAHFAAKTGGYIVECQHCGASGGWGDYGYQAANSWNKRVREIQPASDLQRELTDASKNCWDNFEGLQVVTDWLVERDAMLTPHEDGGGKESGMNIVASIEALLSAARAEAKKLRQDLDQSEQDRKQADVDSIRALGERNDARAELAAKAEELATANESTRKYASELQELCDIIMNGSNAPAPFVAVKERLRDRLYCRESSTAQTAAAEGLRAALETIHKDKRPHEMPDFYDVWQWAKKVAGDALALHPTPSPWRPVAEAPKTGERILAVHEGCDPEIVRWDDSYDLWRQSDWEELVNPTHFMPLPTPPTTI